MPCLIVAGSISYYFFSYLPKNNAVLLSAQLQKECLQIGNKRIKEDEDYDKTHPFKEGDLLSSSDFVFNKDKNLCLYVLRSFDKDYTSGTIIDLFSNKRISDYIETGGEVSYGSKEDFLKIKKENFR